MSKNDEYLKNEHGVRFLFKILLTYLFQIDEISVHDHIEFVLKIIIIFSYSYIISILTVMSSLFDKMLRYEKIIIVTMTINKSNNLISTK